MYSIPWHKRQKNILEKYLKENSKTRWTNVPNAILFSWEEWVGKFEIWKDFAKKFLWDFFKNNFIEINQEKILIEDIREIIKEDAKTSIWSKKIFLIKNIENMNINSSNAFLKTLEESKNSIFICTTENKNLLLPTIISRFQEIEFFKLSDSEIKEFLEENNFSWNLEDAINFSFWKIKFAKKILEDLNFLEEQKKIFEDWKRFLENISPAKIILKSDFLFKNRKKEWDKKEWDKKPDLIKNEIFFLENFLWKNWEKFWWWKKFFWEKKFLKVNENFLELKKWLKSNQNLKLVFDNFYISVI